MNKKKSQKIKIDKNISVEEFDQRIKTIINKYPVAWDLQIEVDKQNNI